MDPPEVARCLVSEPPRVFQHWLSLSLRPELLQPLVGQCTVKSVQSA